MNLLQGPHLGKSDKYITCVNSSYTSLLSRQQITLCTCMNEINISFIYTYVYNFQHFFFTKFGKIIPFIIADIIPQWSQNVMFCLQSELVLLEFKVLLLLSVACSLVLSFRYSLLHPTSPKQACVISVLCHPPPTLLTFECLNQSLWKLVCISCHTL
jgi:hypothetical protein